jgi:hypothetical protein
LDSIGRRRFEARYGLDIRKLILELNEKPQIKVESCAFVGYFRGERYVLGPLGSVKPAIHNMLKLAKEDQLERMTANSLANN